MAVDPSEARHILRLASLLNTVDRSGLQSLDASEIDELYALYRYSSSLAARLESRGGGAAQLAQARELFARAHMLLYGHLQRPERGFLRRTARFLFADCPRAIRSEWRLIALCVALFYGLSAIAYAAVTRDLELAFTLFDPTSIDDEIRQLRETEAGRPFRGNFTFGLEDSPLLAGSIIGNNVFVSIVFFGSGLCPPLFMLLLGRNALMLGTYTAVAGHWGQARAISSILWCHGLLELQMIVLAGTAGLVLARAVLAPGPRTRRYALQVDASKAWRLLAPVPLGLCLSGLIEGYVSPHAPIFVRVSVAAICAVLLLAWVVLGGRGGTRANGVQPSMVLQERPSRERSSSASAGPQVPAS